MTTGMLYWSDLCSKSFNTPDKISEQQDYKTKAIEHYKKFQVFWKNDDPGLSFSLHSFNIKKNDVFHSYQETLYC